MSWKITLAMVLIFSGVSLLGAQTLVIESSGGPGNDGANIAANLAAQGVIAQNFTLTEGRGDYTITVQITRAGTGHNALFVLYRGEEEVARESIFYRSFIEVPAFMPQIAYSLARAAQPGITAPAPQQVAEAPQFIPQPTPAAEIPVQPIPVLPAVPQLPRRGIPAQPADDAAQEAAAEDAPRDPLAWQNRPFYLGMFMGGAMVGDGFAIGFNFDWFPWRNFGFRMLGLSWSGARTDIQWWASGSGSGEWVTDSFFLWTWPSAVVKFYLGNASVFTAWIGPGLGFADLDFVEIVGVGVVWGFDWGLRIGAGALTLGFNGAYTFGWETFSMSGGSGEVYDPRNVNFGVTYRLGMGRRRDR